MQIRQILTLGFAVIAFAQVSNAKGPSEQARSRTRIMNGLKYYRICTEAEYLPPCPVYYSAYAMRMGSTGSFDNCSNMTDGAYIPARCFWTLPEPVHPDLNNPPR